MTKRDVTADLITRLRTGLMASAAFVRHGPDRDERMNDALDAIDLVGETIFMLREYLRQQSLMKDKWADGDENVKRGLWQRLHELEEPARALLNKIGGGK